VQLVRFLLVGILNTAMGLTCIYAAMWLLHLDYRLANAVGYTVGCGIGFLLNRSWTFRYSGSWWRSLARWLAVVAVAYGLNVLAVVALHEGLHVDAYAAQIGGVAAYTITAFLGARSLAFRDLGRTVRERPT
jgi:putative flippase GtrA